jgi:hypothetical protein
VFPVFRASTIWKAKTEAKCRFFACLAAWKKIPIAVSAYRKLVTTFLQSAISHKLSRTVAADCHTHPVVTSFQEGDIRGWLSSVNRVGSKSEQQINAGIIFFFWWFIERNHRIFYQKECSAPEVASLIKDALSSFRRAFNHP